MPHKKALEFVIYQWKRDSLGEPSERQGSGREREQMSQRAQPGRASLGAGQDSERHLLDHWGPGLRVTHKPMKLVSVD